MALQARMDSSNIGSGDLAGQRIEIRQGLVPLDTRCHSLSQFLQGRSESPAMDILFD